MKIYIIIIYITIKKCGKYSLRICKNPATETTKNIGRKELHAGVFFGVSVSHGSSYSF